jgi:hypothetical protein
VVKHDDPADNVASVLLLILMVPMLCWRAFVLWKLWTWFAVPNGARLFPYSAALGLCLIAPLVSESHPPDYKPTELLVRLITRAIAIAIALGVGALAA